MPKFRIYTEHDQPVHELITMLQQKGYNGIVLEWRGPLHRGFTKGFVLRSPQWIPLGYDLGQAKRKARELPEIVEV